VGKEDLTSAIALNSSAFVFVGFAPIGSFWFGWLGEYVGADWSVAIGGLISAAAAWWIWWYYAPEVTSMK
jgi:hypothetical protein